MPNLDTEEWRVKFDIGYVPKIEFEQSQCTNCSGRGLIGGGLGWMGDPDPCNFCHGTGFISKHIYPKEPEPKLPQDFIDHMRKAYLEYKLK